MRLWRPTFARSPPNFKRMVRTPELHFIDSGLLAVAVGATEDSIEKDRSLLGPLLETYHFSEVMKQAS